MENNNLKQEDIEHGDTPRKSLVVVALLAALLLIVVSVVYVSGLLFPSQILVSDEGGLDGNEEVVESPGTDSKNPEAPVEINLILASPDGKMTAVAEVNNQADGTLKFLDKSGQVLKEFKSADLDSFNYSYFSSYYNYALVPQVWSGSALWVVSRAWSKGFEPSEDLNKERIMGIIKINTDDFGFNTLDLSFGEPDFIYSILEAEPKVEDGYFIEYHMDDWDGRLVSIDSDFEKTVLVSSFREALPELQGLALGRFSFPKESNLLFLDSFLPESDAGRGKIYSYNIETKLFSLMKTATSYGSGWGESVLSPDGTMFVSVSDGEEDNKIYIIDLLNDSVLDTIIFGSGESPVQDRNNLGGAASFDIRWINDDTIEYFVFDSSKKILDPDGYYEKPFLEVRQYKINN